MKWINAKPIRIFGAIGVFLACFCYAYVYYKHLYENGGILSVSAASQHPVAFVWQAIIVNIPIIIFLSLSFVVCRKKATDYLSLTLGKKSAKITVLVLGLVYILSLVRQLLVYDDSTMILLKWVYYLVFVAFCEELEFRALLPAILKDRCNKYVEWLLPNVLFACAHLLLPLVQGKSVEELLWILGNTIVGYVILGLFWEWCKRKSGSLWVGVLIHAIMDFRV